LKTVLKTVKSRELGNGLNYTQYEIWHAHHALKKHNWLQFLLVVEVATLEQQISKFYLQILSTEANSYI